MVKSRGQKPLYDVIGQDRQSSGSRGKILEPLRRLRAAKKHRQDSEKADLGQVAWLRKPKLVQLNAGRLELSLPYTAAITVGLVILLLILVAFRLGQRSSKTDTDLAISEAGAGQKSTGNMDSASIDVRPSAVTGSQEPAKVVRDAKMVVPIPTGDHIIVLVQYDRRADLVPVRKHFADFGIETEIIQEGQWYFLVTKNRYENPKKPGTDGYKARQEIIKAGAKYKAPETYEPFAPNFFSDAYGRKVEN